jgi:hypothetical protein
MATTAWAEARPRIDARRPKWRLAVLLVALANANAARADLWVKEKITGGGEPPSERVSIFAPDRVRIDEGASGFILDAAHERAWIYDGTDGGCRALPAPGTGARRVAPAPVNPNAAKFAEIFGGTLNSLAGSPAMVLSRSDTATIANLEARLWDVVRDNKTIQRRWIATSVQNPDLDAIVQRLQASPYFSMQSGLPEAQISTQTVGLGYPLKVEDLVTGVSVEVIELRSGQQPASAFTPPAGCPER